MVSIVVAQAHNRVIGKTNSMPWYLPADLKHFKEITTDHTVIMGRNTLESILRYLGKPLPNRRNIVITRNERFSAEGTEVAHSLQEALNLVKNDETFIIGGAQIYEQFLPFADKIYLTKVDADIDGDTFFPEISAKEWQEIKTETHQKDEKNPYNYAFVTLVRK